MAMSLEKRNLIAAEKRKLISESALRLFDERGFENTTIADIAEGANISKGLIYKYYSSKEDILCSYYDMIRACEELVESQPTATDSLRLFTTRMLMKYDVSNYHPPVRIIVMCYLRGLINSLDVIEGLHLGNYGRHFLGPIVKRGQDSGEFRAGNSEEMGDIFWHTVIGYVVSTMYSPVAIPMPDIDAIIDTLR